MMAVYRLSRKTVTDLDGIHEYTIVDFGVTQARNYMSGLHEHFENLARQPALGREANKIVLGLRRYEYRSHVVFYVPEDRSMMIVRLFINFLEKAGVREERIPHGRGEVALYNLGKFTSSSRISRPFTITRIP